MKNIIRIISCTIIAVSLLLGNSTTSFASDISSYEMILDEANKRFIPDGAFVAEATVSALVQGAPLMWTLYDVSYMDGTHQ